jgi:VWFA-related protein
MRMLVATAVLGAALGAGATPARSQQPEIPGFVSEVRVNNITVAVQVKDDRGVPVSGLKRDDFRLLENEKLQTLTNFSVVDGGKVSQSQDPTLVGRPAPRRLVVFFDLYLMLEVDKLRTVEEMRSFVAPGMPPGMTMAVVSFDGTLRVNCPPTESHEKVLEALKAVERTPATGLQRQLRLSSFSAPTRVNESWSYYNYRRSQNDEYWDELRRMTGRVEAAFSAAIERFSETPARKIAIMVSPGFPRAENIPMYRGYDFMLDSPPDIRNVGLFGRAAFLASELEYTLYTLDPSGGQYADATTASDARFRVPPQAVDVADVRFWREADRKENLIRAAEVTGGQAIFSREIEAAMADVDRLTASFYSLGFQPDHAGDGKEYRLKVSIVDHPEYSLTYRTSYIDRSFEERDADRTRASLLTGEMTNPLGVLLAFDKPQSHFKFGAAKMKVYRLNAELRIPFAHLTMLPRGELVWGQVQVVLISVDEAGNQSDLAHQKVPIQIPAAKLEEARKKGYFSYRFALELEGGTTSVRIGVNDVLSHVASTVLADVKL